MGGSVNLEALWAFDVEIDQDPLEDTRTAQDTNQVVHRKAYQEIHDLAGQEESLEDQDRNVD